MRVGNDSKKNYYVIDLMSVLHVSIVTKGLSCEIIYKCVTTGTPERIFAKRALYLMSKAFKNGY